jgi:Ca2+:H+ antiporter
MILVSHLIGRDIVPGLQHTDTVMLLRALTASVVIFARCRTIVIEGAVHLILFATYLLLVVQGYCAAAGIILRQQRRVAQALPS